MKRLINFIAKLEPDKKIKIGAKAGSGFFFCGTAGDFCENVEVYDVLVNKETMRRYNRAARTFARYMSGEPGSLSAYVRRANKYNEDFSLDGYMDFLRDYFRACQMRKALLEKRTFERDTYKALAARLLLESYEADKNADEGVLCILTQGYEEGKYWMHKEAKEPIGFGTYLEDKEDVT